MVICYKKKHFVYKNMNFFFFFLINIIKSNTWNKFESIHGYRQGRNHTIKISMKSKSNAQAEKTRISNEPGHEKMCLISYANNKGADLTAHPRSQISTFVVRYLYSIISLDSIAEISRLKLASVAAQAGLCLAWSETPDDTFCRVVAQIHLHHTLL